MIADVAEAAGIEPDAYESRVVIADDVESAILDSIAGDDLICLGVSEKQAATKILWGSLADSVVQNATGNVALVRSEYRGHRTVREGIVERLSS